MKTRTKKTKFIETKTGLAQHCKLGRQALDRYLNMPGAPIKSSKGWPAKKIKTWILQNSERMDTASRLDSEMARARTLLLSERVRAIKLANDKADGILISRSWSDSDIRRRIDACQAVLARIPSRLATELPGLSVPEAEKVLKKAFDEALAKLSEPPFYP